MACDGSVLSVARNDIRIDVSRCMLERRQIFPPPRNPDVYTALPKNSILFFMVLRHVPCQLVAVTDVPSPVPLASMGAVQ